MSKELELGQMAFGNPTGDFGTDEFVDALVEYLLNEVERVFWNKYQKEWSRYDDPGLEGVESHPYYWGEDEERAAKPNLKFDFSPQEIRWYKHPGRGQSCTVWWDEREWAEWFEKALEVIRKNDKDSFEPSED